MTISSTDRKAGPYIGNDVATAFPFAFKVFSSADVYAVLADSAGNESDLALTTDYTISLNADQNANPGGTLTLLSPLAFGYTLTISSKLDYLQPTDLTNNGGFYPKVITNSLDRLTIFCQQLYEQLSRSLKLAISVPPGVKVTLPVPVPYQVLGWDSTGTQIVNLDPSQTSALSTDLASSSTGKGSKMVAFIQRFTGAVKRWVEERLADTVSVKDTGAVGDGVTDDTAAVAAAVARCYATGAWLYWPDGTYLTTANIPNLHDIRHTGPGAIKRSGGLYYWDVADRDTVNIVYCSPSGLDTNDGMSASQPMSLAAVKSYLENIGSRAARGRWRVQFAAGTYTRGLSSNKLPPFARYLELRGTSQNIQAWSAGQAVVYGELRLAQSGAMLYRCIAAGTTGGSEPSARTATVTDGTVIWSYIGGWLPWATGQAVNSGDYRKNAGKVYVAKSSGTTGATGPTHSTGAVSDGTVSWAYIGLELPLPTVEGATIFDGSLNPPVWSAGQAVQIGDARYYGTHCYRARTASTTGATPPTHGAGSASDGTVTWDYIGERDTNVPYRAIDLNPCPRLNVIYAKFNNFQNYADSTAGGVILDGPTEHLLQYTVAGNCYMGAYHHGGSSIYHQNTVYDACDSGIFAIYHIGATIGGPNAAQSTFIKNCNNGVYLSRESVAHVDYCVVDSCRNDGVFASIMSRFRGVYSHFLRNTTAIYCIGASEWGDTPGNDCSFYLQTAEANTTKQRLYAFSRWADGSGYEHQYGGGELRYDWNWSVVTSTASAGDIGTDVIVEALKRLPAAWALESSKKVRVVVRGTLAGTAGTKNLKVALGNANIGATGTMAAGTVGAFVFEVNAVPTGINTWSNSTKLEIGSTISIVNNTGLTAYVLDNNGVDYNNPIRVYRNFAAAGDSVTINSVEVFITG